MNISIYLGDDGPNTVEDELVYACELFNSVSVFESLSLEIFLFSTLKETCRCVCFVPVTYHHQYMYIFI